MNMSLSAGASVRWPAIETDRAHRPIAETHLRAPAGQRKDAADWREAHVALLVDIRRHQADLIHVRGQHHTFTAAGAASEGHQIAQRIHPQIVNRARDLFPDRRPDFLFKARNAEGLGQTFG